MLIENVTVGKLLAGPSGAVYRVTEVRPATVVVLSHNYPQQAGTVPATMELDAAALEKFAPFTGDLP